MFGSARIASRKFHGNRFAGLLLAGAASLLLGACAHNVAETPALQWQVNTVEATDAGDAGMAYGTVEAAPEAGYVYRGGRDPNTGLAYTQL
jgi:hypothetical protein